MSISPEIPSWQILKRRQDFQHVAKGSRFHTELCTLQAIKRGVPPPQSRLGITITKKVGNAVERNHIRRRLRHALRQIDTSLFLPYIDYVIVARRSLLTVPFISIIEELVVAIGRVNAKLLR